MLLFNKHRITLSDDKYHLILKTQYWVTKQRYIITNYCSNTVPYNYFLFVPVSLGSFAHQHFLFALITFCIMAYAFINDYIR